MGLLDYYRQFEDIDQEEWNRGLRERRAKEKATALQRVVVVDLSNTEWPDMPNAEVINAAIARARGWVNSYPDRHAGGIRSLLAERHGVEPEQIVVGNGAAELLQAAAFALLAPGDELVTPWPSYPLYPLMASRAGARPVAVDLAAGRVDSAALFDAVTERTRAVVLCNPNDPTGTYVPAEDIRRLADALPEHVHLLVDEAYVQFQDREREDAVLQLATARERVVVFRTFSKIYGISGLRAGYAVGAPGAGRLLDAIGPALGVNALTQAAVEHALRFGDDEIARRRALVIEQRRRIERALPDLSVDAPESQANFVWLHSPGFTGSQLAAHMEKQGVTVAPGGPLGADDHVRASIRGSVATDRLLSALEELGTGN
jgi:histidinol-phosphate aminotransferase